MLENLIVTTNGRYLRIHCESETVLNDDVDKIVLKRCGELRLEASVGITNLLFKTNGNYGYPNLRHLFLKTNSDMQHLISDQMEMVNYFSCLDKLFLEGMESLENICHMDVRSNPFNKLRVINVSACKQLKNLFPFPVFEGLPNLQEIQVYFCYLMNGIILIKNEETTVKTECSIVSLNFFGVSKLTSLCSNQLTDQNLVPFFNNQVAFPKLESLEFKEICNLKMLWKNNGMISNSFCKLQSIYIRECNNLRYMFPCSAMTMLVSLEVLKISECRSLEAIFEMEESYIVKENDVALPKLSYISLEECRELKSVFPASIKRLPQLHTLQMYENVACELFSEDKTLEIAQSNSSLFHEVVFPNLKKVTMSYKTMKKDILTQFSRSEWFPKVKHLCLHDFDEEEEEDYDVDLMSLPLGFKQILCSLEELKIVHVNKWKDNSEIWKMFIDNLELPLFSNLKSLSIIGCDGLKNLLNSSVVKRLVNLEKMVIESCSGMISILDEEGDDEIIFNKLVELNLDDLKRLECFHFGKSKLMFPCLEKLVIDRCYEMKIFSNAIISTPKLQAEDVESD